MGAKSLRRLFAAVPVEYEGEAVAPTEAAMLYRAERDIAEMTLALAVERATRAEAERDEALRQVAKVRALAESQPVVLNRDILAALDSADEP